MKKTISQNGISIELDAQNSITVDITANEYNSFASIQTENYKSVRTVASSRGQFAASKSNCELQYAKVQTLIKTLELYSKWLLEDNV